MSNVGTLDRILRATVGLALIIVPFLAVIRMSLSLTPVIGESGKPRMTMAVSALSQLRFSTVTLRMIGMPSGPD